MSLAAAPARVGGFVARGDHVVLGTRDVSGLAPWAFEHGAAARGVAAAASQGELLVLAVRGSAAEQVLRAAGEGWEMADPGSVQAARAIEPLCILWRLPGFVAGTWHHALKLLH